MEIKNELNSLGKYKAALQFQDSFIFLRENKTLCPQEQFI
jgi:hypothetical protein